MIKQFEKQFKFGIFNLQVNTTTEKQPLWAIRESPLQKRHITVFNPCFLQASKQPLPQHTPTQDGAGSGKFRRELRARLCCALFNAIPNTCALPESCRPKTRASLIAYIHESPSEQAHRRCKSAKFLRCLPRPTSSKNNLQFGICNL
ncbi:MAG TPA: hypothetical protein ENN43_04555 [bacterium]|nr:hypothetical protein [bacterium]